MEKSADGRTGYAVMIVLDYTDRRPIYEQITARFQDLILKGVLEQDAPMPSVRSLAMDLSINPNTIQRAYMTLEREGWIYSVRGKGSFVASGAEARAGKRKEIGTKLSSLMNEAALLGMTKEEFLEEVRNTAWPEEAPKGGNV